MTAERPYADLTAEALDERIERAENDRADWRGIRRRPFREDGHRLWQEARADARRALDQQIVDGVRDIAHQASFRPLIGAADLLAVAFDERLDAMVTAGIDAASAGESPGDIFLGMRRPEWQERMDALNALVAGLENERTIRALERARADADAKIAAALAE